MRLTGFLHFLLTGQPISASETAAVRKEISFSEAIDAHLEWKQRLVEALDGAKHAPLPRDVGDATACVLGCWIEGAGQRRYGDLSSFAELRAIHRDFHVLAQRVVELHRAHDRKAAEILLRTDFQQASRRIVERLRHLADVFEN